MTTAKTTHTPAPWKDSAKAQALLCDLLIKHPPEHIIRCVNEREGLLHALRSALQALRHAPIEGCYGKDARYKAEQVLARADQLVHIHMLDPRTQRAFIEGIEAFLISRSIDADLRKQMPAVQNENALMNTILSQRDQLQAQSVCYQDNMTEIQLLKAQVVSREKEIDVMMAQRNLAEAKLLVLEQREVGYLSELDDYARTVLNLRSWVTACQAEHGLPRVKP